MSDMLQKLLGVEKTAASLITEAETEGGRLVAGARQEAQRQHTERLKTRASENEAALAAERTRLEEERRQRTQAEKETLEKRRGDVAAFRAAALSFMEKGKE